MTKPATLGPPAVDGRRYHLPSREELGIIVPDGYSSVNCVYFNDSGSYIDRSEYPVRFRGTTYSGTYTDIRQGNPCYALRFKGGSPSPNALLSAYRYRWTGSGLEVKSILLGPAGSHTTLSTISNESYWNNTPASDIATLFFPASGYYNGSSLYDVGSHGCYWSSAEYSSYGAYGLFFYSGNADVTWGSHNKTNRFPVRLLLD